MSKPDFKSEEVKESSMGYHNYTDRELISMTMSVAPKDSITYELAKRLEQYENHHYG